MLRTKLTTICVALVALAAPTPTAAHAASWQKCVSGPMEVPGFSHYYAGATIGTYRISGSKNGCAQVEKIAYAVADKYGRNFNKLPTRADARIRTYEHHHWMHCTYFDTKAPYQVYRVTCGFARFTMTINLPSVKWTLESEQPVQIPNCEVKTSNDGFGLPCPVKDTWSTATFSLANAREIAANVKDGTIYSYEGGDDSPQSSTAIIYYPTGHLSVLIPL